MEYRYVYRGVEDAIGINKEIKESPHSYLTMKLRHDFNESRDLAHHLEVKALCLSSFAGNPKIDTSRVLDNLTTDINNILTTKMPYIDFKEDNAETKKHTNDEYFKQLAEFEKELKDKKNKGNKTNLKE